MVAHTLGSVRRDDEVHFPAFAGQPRKQRPHDAFVVWVREDCDYAAVRLSSGGRCQQYNCSGEEEHRKRGCRGKPFENDKHGQSSQVSRTFAMGQDGRRQIAREAL
jgi:hypothetical protein